MLLDFTSVVSRAYGQDSVFASVAKTVKRDYACTGRIDYTSNSS